MKASMTGTLPAIGGPSLKGKPLTIVRSSTAPLPPEILELSATAMPPEILKLSPTAMPPLTRATTPTPEETARAARRARALKSKTVIAIYMVVTFSVGAALLEMRSRAAAQVAAHPAPHRVAPAPSVATPAPVVAPHVKAPVAPAPPGAPAPWGGWIG